MIILLSISRVQDHFDRLGAIAATAMDRRSDPWVLQGESKPTPAAALGVFAEYDVIRSTTTYSASYVAEPVEYGV
jgi:hypothetical protein